MTRTGDARGCSRSSTGPDCPDARRLTPATGLGYDGDVAKTADDLRSEVLALPAQDRARIATDLLASLDSETVDDNEIDELWSVETQRRAAMLDTGEAGTISWSEIEHRFAERRAQRHA